MLCSEFAALDTTPQHWQLCFLATCCWGPARLEQPGVGSMSAAERELQHTSSGCVTSQGSASTVPLGLSCRSC